MLFCVMQFCAIDAFCFFISSFLPAAEKSASRLPANQRAAEEQLFIT